MAGVKSSRVQLTGHQNYMLPSTQPAQFRSDAVIVAEELSKAVDWINWPLMPEIQEFKSTADHIIAAGYYPTQDFIDASKSERTQLLNILPGGKAGWVRLLRKMLGAEALPTEADVRKSAPCKEIWKADKALGGKAD